MNGTDNENVPVDAYTIDYEASNVDVNLTMTSWLGTDPIRWSWDAKLWSWYVICELVTAVVGIAGNLLVIVVVFGRRAKCRSTDILVGNLAIADFLTSVLLIPYPQVKSIPNTWAGAIFCKIMKGNYLMWTSVTASIYTLVAISFDRFFAVVYPMYFKRFVNRRLMGFVVALIWVGSALLVTRILVTNTTDAVEGQCIFQRPSAEHQISYGMFVFVVRLALPTVVMLSTQLVIARSLHREAARFKSAEISNSIAASFHSVARSRIIKLMFTVVLIYILCWAPNQIAFMFFNLGIIPASYLRSPPHRLLTVIAFCNSCVNPILYTLRHPQFRKAVREFFRSSPSTARPIFEDLESLKT
ncbi:allatostatin-A receptor-like [Diadema antillarum]|uniref:allatostatin-A receptor-like n=1 Tax=Diadema antillarum TaxID=105358 RepID=UPI003A88F486